MPRTPAEGSKQQQVGFDCPSVAAGCVGVAVSAVQVKKCADAGADIVRITVQGRKEAEACMKIREQLFKDRWVGGCVF